MVLTCTLRNLDVTYTRNYFDLSNYTKPKDKLDNQTPPRSFEITRANVTQCSQIKDPNFIHTIYFFPFVKYHNHVNYADNVPVSTVTIVDVLM